MHGASIEWPIASYGSHERMNCHGASFVIKTLSQLPMNSDFTAKTPEELEEWFLTGLAAEPIRTDEMFSVLAYLASDDDIEQRRSWAELLQDALVSRDDVTTGLKLLGQRCQWNSQDPRFRSECRGIARVILEKDRQGQALIKGVGFDDKTVSAADCIRRLNALVNFDAGKLCLDKTWGFGVMQRIDTFYQKILIDFDKRPNHEMSFEYAADALKLIAEDHLLARRHKHPGQIEELAKSNPTEVARIALQSYGPMNVVILQEVLVGENIVAESDWKTFWAGARRGLKADRTVLFPAKRIDPIQLLDAERGYDQDWFDKLAAERGLKEISDAMEELATDGKGTEITDDFRLVIENRLAFLLDGAGRLRPELVIRALIACRSLGIAKAESDGLTYARRFFDHRALVATGTALPARALRAFLAYLLSVDRDSTLSALTDGLLNMPMALFNEAMEFFDSADERERRTAALRACFGARKASLEMLYWLGRRIELIESLSLGTVFDFVLQSLVRLAEPQSGEGLKAAKQLRALFDKKEWLSTVVQSLNSDERRDFMIRLRDTSAWSAIDRNSIMAKIIVLYPELHEVLMTEDSKDDGVREGRFTSWVSYKEREALLEKLQKVTIPQNSKAIALARGYGDLKENHAYKAAKEEQAMLLSRRDAFAEEMKTVKGTDFAGFPADVAAVGTQVFIELATGTEEQYYILGEWDSQPDRGMISCKSPLAQALTGHIEGDSVKIPGEDSAECRITKVQKLPADMVKWARG